jgi:glycosyltransferase involved in cell wall biosynthesis
MANYNHAQYVGEALQTILEQAFRPTEVVVVDDGSTDDSIAVIEQFARRDPIIHLVRNIRNRGAVFSQNRALNMASGDYVCAVSADDKVLPGFFEKSMMLLAQYPQAGLCCSDPVFFEDGTGIIHENKLFWSENPCYLSPEELAAVIRGRFIAGHTSIVKRSALLEAGGLMPEFRWHCDWFAMLVIGFRYGICYIPEPLAALRVRPNSYSASGTKNRTAQCEVLNQILYHLKLPSYRDVLPYFYRGRVLYTFKWDICRVIFSNPKYWNFQSIRLVIGYIFTTFKSAINPIVPPAIRHLYHKVIGKK